jgi:membrane protein implicated in regulation of membrane protease activity
VITLIIHILIAAIIVGLLLWLLAQIPFFAPYAQIVRIVVLVLFVLWIILQLLPLLGVRP